MYNTLFPDYFLEHLSNFMGPLGIPLQILQRLLYTESGFEVIKAFESDQQAGLDSIYQSRYNQPRKNASSTHLSADILLLFAIARAYHPDCFGERGWGKLISNTGLQKALANLGCSSFPGRSTVHEHYNFLSENSIEKLHQLILEVIHDEQIDDFSWLTMDTTAIASVSTWPVDSEMLFRLIEKTYQIVMAFVDARRTEKGWGSKVKRLPLKGIENLFKKLHKTKLNISFAKGKKGARKTRRSEYIKMCTNAEKLLAKLGDLVDKLQYERLDPSLVQKFEEVYSLADDRLFYVQKRFKMAEAADLGDYDPELVLSLSDNDAVFIKKGGRETVFGYKPNICRSAQGFITGIYLETGNPADSTLLLKSTKMVIKNTNVTPVIVSTDDGFASAAGEKEILDLGVQVFCASGSKGKKLIGEELWELDLFKEIRRMRSNVEATISHFKNDFNMTRLTVGSRDAVYREIMFRAIAFNLEKLGKIVTQREKIKEAA